DERRIITDNDDRGVAQILKLLELAQGNGMAQMNVDARWVDAVLDTQRAALADRLFQFLAKLLFRDDGFDATAKNLHLEIEIDHRSSELLRCSGSRAISRRHRGIGIHRGDSRIPRTCGQDGGSGLV